MGKSTNVPRTDPPAPAPVGRRPGHGAASKPESEEPGQVPEDLLYPFGVDRDDSSGGFEFEDKD